MANLKETYQNSENTNNPNATSHYTFLTLGLIIGFAGIFMRFIVAFPMVDVIANILFIAGILMSLKAVFDILK
jgi:hypothetical protein